MLIHLLIFILVLGLVAWIALYIIDLVPMPPPFKQVAKAIFLVVVLLILLMQALPMAGVSLP